MTGLDVYMMVMWFIMMVMLLPLLIGILCKWFDL
jgi:hypothetical protein